MYRTPMYKYFMHYCPTRKLCSLIIHFSRFLFFFLFFMKMSWLTFFFFFFLFFPAINHPFEPPHRPLYMYAVIDGEQRIFPLRTVVKILTDILYNVVYTGVRAAVPYRRVFFLQGTDDHPC